MAKHAGLCCQNNIMSLLYGFVDSNQLTGNLDPLFCNIDAYSELRLYVDCFGSELQVVCSCSDACFWSVRLFICNCQSAYGRLGFVKRQTTRISACLFDDVMSFQLINIGICIFRNIMVWNSHLLRSNRAQKYQVALARSMQYEVKWRLHARHADAAPPCTPKKTIQK
jgi:hypothetical protein